MALKNLLGDLALEDTAHGLLLATERAGRHARVLPYARDAGDRIRAVLDLPLPSGALGLGYTSSQHGAQGATPVWYAPNGSPNSVDPREQLRAAAETNFMMRRQRWTYG